MLLLFASMSIVLGVVGAVSAYTVHGPRRARQRALHARRRAIAVSVAVTTDVV